MTANYVYAIGTILSWIGWFLALRALYLGAQLVAGLPGTDTQRVQKGVLVSALVAAATLGFAEVVPKGLPTAPAGAAAPSAVQFPLVWFVMPYSAWLALVCGVMIVVRLSQALLSLPGKDRQSRLSAAACWAVAAAVFVWLYKRDPADKIDILRGSIPFSTGTAAILLLLVVAGVFAMVLAGRSTAGRGASKTTVTQAALLAGTVVFGLPFAFLVITSFKEDRDMASPNGIVWIPKVQQTVPYYDPKDPQVEATYKGDTVTGSVLSRNSDGTITVDIGHPLSIAGETFSVAANQVKSIPKQIPVVEGKFNGVAFTGKTIQNLDDGSEDVVFMTPPSLAGKEHVFAPGTTDPVRHVGLRWQNYPEALEYLPPETHNGLVYLKNTLIIVLMSVIGTVFSSAIVAYAFSRMKFPGRDALFAILLSTMMLPGAVTLMPQFLIFRWLGWIDTLYPLWVPAFFASAFNVFLLRQFFKGIPMELEDASKIDGCSYIRTFWSIMMPQIKPALTVIAIWTFIGAWNNFMGPLIYINSPENMPLSYALQLFQGQRGGEPGMLMAFATLTMLPVLLLFFFAQRYFIEGVALSGLGGR